MNKFLINQRSRVLCFLWLFALYLVCFSFEANAQQVQQSISGTVRDAQGVLPGVTVLVKGKSSGTLTDAHGRFMLDAEPTAVLVFS